MVYDILVYLHTNFSIVLIGLICLIALLCFVLTWRRFRAETVSQRAGKKEPESPAMEGALKQLLKEVQTSPQAAQPVSLEALTEKDRQRLEREVQKKLEAAGDPAAAEGAEVLQQLKRSEAELAQLQLKLKELKAGQEASTETERDAGEVEALQTRVQELEARLKEYEIIEDDIADLSTYKEENTRLRRQIEDLTGDAPLEKSGEQEVTPRKVAPSEKAAEAMDSAPEISSSVSAGPETPSAGEAPVEDIEEESAPTAPVNAEQLLAEVDELLTLGEEMSSDSSGLEEDLNTEKLIQEAAELPKEGSGG